MAAPSMVTRSGNNLIVRSVVSGDALFGTEVPAKDPDEFDYYDLSEGEASEGAAEGVEEGAEGEELPQCKVKRNYSCVECDYYTQNPRFYLYHQKQVHEHNIRIYECDHCLYASKHSQKLQRHVHMVHLSSSGKRNRSDKVKAKTKQIKMENAEEAMVEDENGEERIYTDETGAQIYKCTVCDMTSTNRSMVARHERMVHLKKKFYRCTKCNYVTHMKARYTKHVKYHSMPMIKCDMCDFRTPYKWNLDRHNKNHTGDGPFKCSACNFTAEIKQSLTVHEMNHHVPPVGHLVVSGSNARRRLKVGASDTMGLVTEEDQIDQSELELLRLEREGAAVYEQNPADFVQAQLDIPGDNSSTAGRETPSISNQSADGRPLIHTEKYTCKLCDFRGNLNEVQRHELDEHQIGGIFREKKQKRPIPNLIPLQSGQKPLPKPSELTKENVNKVCGTEPIKDFTTLVNVDSHFKDLEPPKSPNFSENDRKSDSFKRKNASFFDKLKEKLMTSANLEGTLTCSFCGHEAKCLTEHIKHQKSHMPGEKDDQSESSYGSQGVPYVESSSTRCQYCRHRCKTSTDLMLHLQTCKEVPNPRPVPTISIPELPDDDENRDCGIGVIELKPHPMENKVFIWNHTERGGTSSSQSSSALSPASSPLKISEEKVFVGIEVKPGYGTATDGQEEAINSKDVNTKKVFKCPHCSFWASTASRFHVHIVGHLNKRPFQCSLCHYSSNWRWDITKHIRLKTVRDPTHEKAKVLLTDETGRRNYSKYNKYLTTIKMETQQQPPKYPKRILPRDGKPESPQKTAIGSKRPPESVDENDSPPPKKKPNAETKKTMWKCKKCNFRDGDREVVLEHVRDHYRNAAEGSKKKKKLGSKSSKKETDVPTENGDQGEREKNGPEFMCETCPFTCRTWNELEAHSEKHFVCTLNRKQFKCQQCPYYAQDNDDLTAHSNSHGEANKDRKDGKTGHLACLQCPYTAVNKTQLIYHRKRHNQPDSPHKCYKCSYGAPNNTILALHVRLHGRHNATEQPTSSPAVAASALDKTPITVHAPVDISRTDTTGYPDVPMVWVSRAAGLVKMFKCRFCPHLNMRKTNIVEHEKMHSSGGSPSPNQIKCPDCSYVCCHAGVLASHSKVHQALNGLIVGIVDSSVAEDEQIDQMKERLHEFETNQPNEFAAVAALNGDTERTMSKVKNDPDRRILCFCSMCPARFLHEKDMKIHMRFHELKLVFKCESCSYTARQKTHVETHYKVHTDDYQERTRVLIQVYDIDMKNPQPKIVNVSNGIQEAVWVVSSSEKEENGANDSLMVFKCSKCPAEFYKSFTLSYHETLHGGPGPHKCKFCDYAVKTYGNLLKHEMVHKGQRPLRTPKIKIENNVTSGDQRKSEGSRSPAKSPPLMDPEFGLLIHGNPNFTYATYVKNGKVKEKRYKCHKCPSAFEKRDQYKIHLMLHGSKQRYSCDRCDYSVKYYANYIQHLKKHKENEVNHKDGKRTAAVFSDNDDDATNDTDDTSSLRRRSVDRCGKAMKLSMADEQALMLMQQKNILAHGGLVQGTNLDAISRCPHCPYTNNRKDGVASHIRCHSNPRGGPYVCKYCDYTVPQLHFLRDHMKVHFNQPKFVKPDAYMKVERMEIWAETANPSIDSPKFLVFKDNGENGKDDRFLPKKQPSMMENSTTKVKTYINLKTGEEDVEQVENTEENATRSRRLRKVNGDSLAGDAVEDDEEDDDYNPHDDEASVRTMDEDSQSKTEPGLQDQQMMDSSKSTASSDTELSDTSCQSKQTLLPPVPPPSTPDTIVETTEQRLNE